MSKNTGFSDFQFLNQCFNVFTKKKLSSLINIFIFFSSLILYLIWLLHFFFLSDVILNHYWLTDFNNTVNTMSFKKLTISEFKIRY